ncbi:hypothetical protein Q4Y15_001531 [Campylobacter fetus]|uniref:CDP-Glycerol:Poly(Glycerophosphate) glycerophosphotransferase n=3 Tax=Campylobacter fetus TaxID=196 RepID=A0RRB8_CAMFF|nr:hypothetical protein [Campylobacter fetus]ABK82360.1 conserved hypothetical protein [Campylobacter fetus subsp. fetus 82-40]EAI3916479.1 hypothetical protein [Campylobacter fetus]EAI3919840.1 hypothetical protein [Campylobacter fetus]EAJ0321674.1 hypothetical protein [Campylobacter fetus]EAJ0323384.1 hypothetical protein [Campylobacter fetus]
MTKHYFIYPNGGHSKMLAHNLDLLGHSYTFLDDFKESMSLESNLKFIKDNGGGSMSNPILLACDSLCQESIELKDKLRTKVENLGLACEDGFIYIMDELNSYIKSATNPKNKTLGLHMYGRVDKRYSSLYLNSISGKLNIVYIFSTYDELNNNKSLNNTFAMPFEHIKYLNSLQIILSTTNKTSDGKILLSLNHKIIVMAHAYTFPNGYLAYDDINSKYKKCAIKFNINENMPYILVSSKTNYQMAMDYFKELYGYETNKFIKAGYPPLDENIKNYEAIKKQTPDTILLATRSKRVLHLIKPVASKLLNLGYKLHFRPHPQDCGHKEFQDFASEFENIENFTIDMNYKGIKQSKFSMDTLSKMICIVTDYSSFAYTLPITNLRPAILFYPDTILQKCLEEKINNKIYKFNDDRLHIVAKTGNEVLDAVQNLNLEEWEKKILDYRNDEIYNIKNSSKFIAEFITNL